MQLIAQQYIEVKVPKQNQGDVWTGVNVSGKVYLQIRTRDGKNRAKFWWIKTAGIVEHLGEHGPAASFDIPKVYGKLRVQTLDGDTILYVSDSATVDQRVTFKW
jgi:hypothetical protein